MTYLFVALCYSSTFKGVCARLDRKETGCVHMIKFSVNKVEEFNKKMWETTLCLLRLWLYNGHVLPQAVQSRLQDMLDQNINWKHLMWWRQNLTCKLQVNFTINYKETASQHYKKLNEKEEKSLHCTLENQTTHPVVITHKMSPKPTATHFKLYDSNSYIYECKYTQHVPEITG